MPDGIAKEDTNITICSREDTDYFDINSLPMNSLQVTDTSADKSIKNVLVKKSTLQLEKALAECDAMFPDPNRYDPGDPLQKKVGEFDSWEDRPRFKRRSGERVRVYAPPPEPPQREKKPIPPRYKEPPVIGQFADRLDETVSVFEAYDSCHFVYDRYFVFTNRFFSFKHI